MSYAARIKKFGKPKPFSQFKSKYLHPEHKKIKIMKQKIKEVEARKEVNEWR